MKVNRKNHLQQNKTRKQIVQYSHRVHLMLKKKKNMITTKVTIV